MAIEVLTREDLQEFRVLLLDDLKKLLGNQSQNNQKWLKSLEVRRMLNISPGTLQNLRVTKTISYTKIGGIIYYSQEDIEKLLERNKVKEEQNLFNSK